MPGRGCVYSWAVLAAYLRAARPPHVRGARFCSRRLFAADLRHTNKMSVVDCIAAASSADFKPSRTQPFRISTLDGAAQLSNVAPSSADRAYGVALRDRIVDDPRRVWWCAQIPARQTEYIPVPIFIFAHLELCNFSIQRTLCGILGRGKGNDHSSKQKKSQKRQQQQAQQTHHSVRAEFSQLSLTGKVGLRYLARR